MDADADAHIEKVTLVLLPAVPSDGIVVDGCPEDGGAACIIR